MCERIYEAPISILHLGMRSKRDVSYHAFRGYVFWAGLLQGERKLQMLIAARKAYEVYKAIKTRQDDVTDIIHINFKEAA